MSACALSHEAAETEPFFIHVFSLDTDTRIHTCHCNSVEVCMRACTSACMFVCICPCHCVFHVCVPHKEPTLNHYTAMGSCKAAQHQWHTSHLTHQSQHTHTVRKIHQLDRSVNMCVFKDFRWFPTHLT